MRKKRRKIQYYSHLLRKPGIVASLRLSEGKKVGGIHGSRLPAIERVNKMFEAFVKWIRETQKRQERWQNK